MVNPLYQSGEPLTSEKEVFIMTKAECALHMIKKEREQNHTNRLFAREINAVYEQHPSDVYAFGIDMFLLGLAKGRRMEKAARKGGAQND